MTISANTIIGVVMSGLLGLLWFDLRSIRKNVHEEMAGYLTEEKHGLLCENSMLRVEKKIDTVKDEIIKEIKNNGK